MRGSRGFHNLRNPAKLAAVLNLLNQPRTAALALLLFAPAPPLAAQRLLDLPVRAWAGADATASGAVAAFWNPAAAIITGRAEAMVLDVLAPEPTGLGGFAAAAAFRVDSALTLAIGYHHVGVDGIMLTTDSPLPEDATPLELGEDALALSARRALGQFLAAGVSLRYVRAAEFAEDRSVLEFGAGIHLRPELPGRPVIGAAARAESEGMAWMTGIDVTPFLAADDEWRLGASWGADGGPLRIGVSHRLAALAGWRDVVRVSAGMSGEPDADGRTWRPVASASVRLARYALGVMREQMANDFGAVHALRFTIAF